ncbi:GPP34 family phosphoprotein [Streptomyces xinghaiensis]|uniref:GPP34 family phosphoprotein n=1 Tax=Streptomyces xinghaiensis TaxID=1038928 RepID=UPI003795BAF3
MTEALQYRMYLLAYDAAVHGPFNRSRSGFLVRAALLTELALRGEAVEADGEVRLREPQAGTGPWAGGTQTAPAARGTGWCALLLRDRDATLRTVEEHLAARGLLVVEDCRALVAPVRRVTLTDRNAARTVHRQAAGVLHGPEPADRVPVRDAALLALAAMGGMSQVVSRTDPRQRARIEALTSRIGDIAPGLEQAVRALRGELARSGHGLASPRDIPATSRVEHPAQLRRRVLPRFL